MNYKLLSQIAAFRSTTNYEALSLFNDFESEVEFDNALNELIERGLLFFNASLNCYDLHPLIRWYAYDRLMDKPLIHAKMADYLGDRPTPKKVNSINELTPTIELFYQLTGAKRFSEAYNLLGHLRQWLYYQFGAYHIYAQVLRTLVSEPGPDVPGMDTLHKKAFVLNALANCLCFTGYPGAGLPLFERAVELETESGINYPVHVGNLAVRCLLPLGKLTDAEHWVRRRIEVCRDKFQLLRNASNPEKKSAAGFYHHNEKIGHSDLGQILSIQGRWPEAKVEFTTALRMFSDAQSKGIVHRLRGQALLMAREAGQAAKEARLARDMATDENIERDIIYADTLLGMVDLFQAKQDAVQGSRWKRRLPDTEKHLVQTLDRCRHTNLVEAEPEILLTWADWHSLQNNRSKGLQYSLEALSIADRCEYRLKQADIHNFLARLELNAGNRAEARQHAEIAKERAWCDGPPYCYKPALDEAERLLRVINQSS